MTPTSPLAGLLTGLSGGLLVAVAVFLIVAITARRQRASSAAVHPVAEDVPTTLATSVGEFPKAYAAPGCI